MRHRTTSQGKRRRALGIAATLLLLACAACTLILNRTSTQCSSDSDCSHFGGHPYCQGGVCVSSGLGPSDCNFGTPQNAAQFQNQCTNASCLSFDNCGRMGLCNDASNLDVFNPPPVPEAAPPVDAGMPDAPDLPLCMDPDNGRANVVIINGSSNFPPLLTKLAPIITQATGYIPVYQVTNSCTGVKSIFTAGAGTLVDPKPGPAAKYAQYYSGGAAGVNCTLGPEGAPVDVGESDIFSSTCAGYGSPTDSIGEYFGPIQGMAFIVPGKSQETAITEEAAHAVFGSAGAVPRDGGLPWTDPSLYFIRNSGTGTQQMIGHAIDVPAGNFWGIDRSTALNVQQLMQVITDPTQAEQAIGIISVDYYDDDRTNLKALAFKATGQECAYLPDSTEFSTDKQNIRDGHYPIWGPLHFYTNSSNGGPVSVGAQNFVSVLTLPNIAQSLLDAFIQSSLVPSCAMSVTRSTELGPLSAYTPPSMCDCYFLASKNINGAAPSVCTPCSTAANCPSSRPACNHGYCEPQ